MYQMKTEEVQDRLSSIMENSDDAIISKTLDGSILSWNKGAEKIYGYSAEEIIGQPISILFPPDRSKEIMLIIEKIKKGEHIEHFETIRTKKDGTQLFISLTISPIKDREGNIVGASTIARDVTEQKETENRLKKSEHKLKERVKELNCLYGISSLIETKDISIEKILEGTLNLIPSAWQYPEITSTIIFYDQKKFKTKNYKKTKWKLMSKIEVNMKELVLEVNYLEDYQFLKEEELLINDITDRLKVILEHKEAELRLNEKEKMLERKVQELRESEEKYRRLIEDSTEGVWVFDENAKTSLLNPRMAEMLGYTINEMNGKSLYAFMEENEAKKTKLKFKNRKDNIKEEHEIEFLHKNGNKIYTILSSSPIFDQNGKFKGTMAFIKDITERKRAEKLIIEENLKLAELNRIKKSLITRISHELKTPLNAINSASHLLLNFYKDDMSEKVLEHNLIISKGSQRLKALIEGILDISRLEEDSLELNKKKEDIVKIMEDCVADLSYMSNNRNISIYLDFPHEIDFEVDKIRFEQVIMNILTNAIKNTPKKGKIYLNINKNDEYIEISIRDTGVGLTEDEKNKLFTKFGKIERHGKRLDVDTEGSGLGLFISKELVELHDGEILVESDGRNKGATFKIRLYKNKKKPLISTNI